MPSIILSDNGVSSGSAGLKSTAASDGALALQTTTAGGVATTAISIDTSQNVTFANQPTFTGGTANGVLYLNGSKAVTSGSALTFDGTTFQYTGASAFATASGGLTVGSTSASGFKIVAIQSGTVEFDVYANSGGTGALGTTTNHPMLFLTNNTERMRLDTSGNLGLGVTPSAWNSAWKAFEFKAAGNALVSGGNADVRLFSGAYFDSGGFKYGVSGTAVSYYYQGAGAHSWYTAASGTAGNAITFTQAMTLNTSGQLGIGTTSPTYNLHVVDTVAAVGSLRGNLVARGNYAGSTDIGHLYFQNASDIPVANIYAVNVNGGANDSGTMIFRTASSGSLAERARITSGGQFCVNTTNTNGAFNVSGNVYLFSQSSGAGNSTLKWNSGTGQVTYDTSSRLVKTDIVDSPYGLAEVLQLKSRKYFRTDDQRDEIGLVADEVQEVLPEFVPLSPKSIFTGNEEDTELVPSGVYYEKLSSVLIKAIQELNAKIEAQAAEIAAMKGA